MEICARNAVFCVRIAQNHARGGVLRSFERKTVPFEPPKPAFQASKLTDQAHFHSLPASNAP
jgi:hypothetical protein